MVKQKKRGSQFIISILITENAKTYRRKIHEGSIFNGIQAPLDSIARTYAYSKILDSDGNDLGIDELENSCF